MRRMLIFIAGTKGGVGKSFASVMLAGAALDLGLSLRMYDTDNENRTLSTLMKTNCRFLDEHETYPLDEVVNSLYESSPVSVTIVDMKAGTSRSTQEWFLSVPWDAVRKIDVDVYVAGCVTSDPDSVRTFGPWLDYFRRIDFPVHFLLIKNAKEGDNFFVCTSLLELGMREMALNYTAFFISPIEQEYIGKLNNNDICLRDYLHGKGPKELLPTIMQKSRLRNHYYAITDQFVDFFVSKMESGDMNDSRKKIHTAVQKRIALRAGMQAGKSERETETN